MTDKLDTTAIRAQMAALDGHTPGPWDWEVSRSSRQVELCGGKNAHDLTVMSFVRWGMNKAAPVFWFWRGNVSDEPKRADALATPAPGREHHADWFQRIDHPDARLIAAAPDLLATTLSLCDAVDALRAENERLRAMIRVNAIRYLNMSHEDIDAAIRAALSSTREKV